MSDKTHNAEVQNITKHEAEIIKTYLWRHKEKWPASYGPQSKELGQWLNKDFVIGSPENIELQKAIRKAMKFFVKHEYKRFTYTRWYQFIYLITNSLNQSWEKEFGFAAENVAAKNPCCEIQEPSPPQISRPKVRGTKINIYGISLAKVKEFVIKNNLHTNYWSEDELFDMFNRRGIYKDSTIPSEVRRAHKYAIANRYCKTWQDWVRMIVAAKSWLDIYKDVPMPDKCDFQIAKCWMKDDNPNKKDFYVGHALCGDLDTPHVRALVRYEAKVNRFETWGDWAKALKNAASFKDMYADKPIEKVEITSCSYPVDFDTMKTFCNKLITYCYVSSLGKLFDAFLLDDTRRFYNSCEFQSPIKATFIQELKKGKFPSWTIYIDTIRGAKSWGEVEKAIRYFNN